MKLVETDVTNYIVATIAYLVSTLVPGLCYIHAYYIILGQVLFFVSIFTQGGPKKYALPNNENIPLKPVNEIRFIREIKV